MPNVNIKQAKDFFAKITSKDKVLVIHHDDLDGYSSGILFYDFCKKKGAKVGNFAFSLGDDQKPIIQKTKKFNKIILTDLAPNTIQDLLNSLRDKDVFYTDHHLEESNAPKNIIELRTTSEGYIPSSRTAYEIVGGKYWLSICGTLSDMGHLHEVNKSFLEIFFAKHNISQKQFLENIVFTTNKFLVYFNNKPQKAFLMLAKIRDYKDIKKLKKYARPVEKEIQKHIKSYKKNHEKIGEVSFYHFESKYHIKSTVSTQISFIYPNDLIVFAVSAKDQVRLSSRTRNPKANMIQVLKTGISDLKDASAGGHIPAAGGHIKAKDLEKFKKNLKKYKM